MSQDPGIKAFMKLIQSEFFMQLCIKEGKSPSDVFKLLKLHEEGESLFDSPLLNTWMNCVDTYTKFHGEHVPLFATLKEQFNAEKEVELIRMVFDAEFKQQTVVRIRAEQLKTWLGKGISPEDVFNLLELTRLSLHG